MQRFNEGLTGGDRVSARGETRAGWARLVGSAGARVRWALAQVGLGLAGLSSFFVLKLFLFLFQ